MIRPALSGGLIGHLLCMWSQDDPLPLVYFSHNVNFLKVIAMTYRSGILYWMLAIPREAVPNEEMMASR